MLVKNIKELIFRITLLPIFVIILYGVVLANPDWENKVKNERGLVIEQSQFVEITINAAGKLEIVAEIHEETQHFSDNANLYREQSIGYSNTFTEIFDIEAYSLIPTDKNRFRKISVIDFVTSDSRSAGIFYDDQKKISYIFPALNEGAKTVLSYKKKYLEPRLWGYYMFSSYFPVQKSVFTVKAPETVKLNFHKFGISDDQIEFTIDSKGKYNIYTWSASTLDKIQISKGADGILHTAPHLIIYVDSYEYNGISHNILRDVNDLHTWYQNFLSEKNSEDSEAMKNMVENIVKGKSTELEKVEAIYEWVQQNIKYIAIEDGLGGFRPRSSNTVFTRRYGDCKDMSNLIHNMLDLANIPSHLAWIGTTAIPYSHREVPTPMADNHMICTYVNNDQYYFLDATDQYNTLGIPTSHIQGREALINKGINDFELVNVPVVPSEGNLVIDSVFLSINDDEVKGTGNAAFSGYSRIPVTNNLENLQGDDKKVFLSELLKKGNNKFSLDSVTTQNVAEKNSKLIIDYDFTVEDYLWRSSNEIFINPHMDKNLSSEMIDISSTNSDIYYPYKRQRSNIFCIQIPQQFEVTFLPDNVQYDDGDFGFSIGYQVNRGKIIVHQKVKINTLHLKTEQFESWNKMIKGLFAAYKESIVLGKILN